MLSIFELQTKNISSERNNNINIDINEQQGSITDKKSCIEIGENNSDGVLSNGLLAIHLLDHCYKQLEEKENDHANNKIEIDNITNIVSSVVKFSCTILRSLKETYDTADKDKLEKSSFFMHFIQFSEFQ